MGAPPAPASFEGGAHAPLIMMTTRALRRPPPSSHGAGLLNCTREDGRGVSDRAYAAFCVVNDGVCISSFRLRVVAVVCSGVGQSRLAAVCLLRAVRRISRGVVDGAIVRGS